jgi:hypothetical protein
VGGNEGLGVVEGDVVDALPFVVGVPFPPRPIHTATPPMPIAATINATIHVLDRDGGAGSAASPLLPDSILRVVDVGAGSELGASSSRSCVSSPSTLRVDGPLHVSIDPRVAKVRVASPSGVGRIAFGMGAAAVVRPASRSSRAVTARFTRWASPRATSSRSTFLSRNHARSTRAMSSACCGRLFTSSASIDRTTSSSGERLACAVEATGGVSCSAVADARASARRNGGRPVHASSTTVPNAKTSAAPVSARPSICSGGMCPGVPNTSTSRPPAGAAMPKSSSFTAPSSSSITLPGVTSRWMTPRRCA